MRIRLPELNKTIDTGERESLEIVAVESILACQVINRDCPNERERFTYISMIHSSLFRHQRAVPSKALESALRDVESLMILLAASLGVETRFLAVFYLLHNPEVDGLHAQFLPGKDEADFAGANRLGMQLFQRAALGLLEAYKQLCAGPATREVVDLLSGAAKDFSQIVEVNRELGRTLDRDQFRALTEYFQNVVVQGRDLRGVNAGDQPWSYIIDLLLGVDLKHVFEVAFDRKYPPEVLTVADAIIYEFNHGDYLKRGYLLPEDYTKLEETEAAIANGQASLPNAIRGDNRELLNAMRSAIESYLMTSNTHLGLAKKYVPVDSQTHVQIGSSGTNIQKFLKDGLIDERARVLADLEHST